MSIAKRAAQQAAEFFEEVGRGLIRDAVEFRRRNPCYFARVRANMVRMLREEKPVAWRARAAWHDKWRRIHEARCKADHAQLAEKCIACEDGEA